MKTTVDIPADALRDAMRFSGAKTKKEAILAALADYNRRKRVEMLISMAGTFPDFPTNDEIEAADTEHEERMRRCWEGKP
jgi:hypothetical protein